MHGHVNAKTFYSPTDAQVNCLKNNIKTYIKIYIKTAPTYFVAVTNSSGSALFVLATVTVALPADGVTALQSVGAVLMLI
jgi:hypothetical protein